MALQQSSCLLIPNAEITGVSHHDWVLGCIKALTEELAFPLHLYPAPTLEERVSRDIPDKRSHLIFNCSHPHLSDLGAVEGGQQELSATSHTLLAQPCRLPEGPREDSMLSPPCPLFQLLPPLMHAPQEKGPAWYELVPSPLI